MTKTIYTKVASNGFVKALTLFFLKFIHFFDRVFSHLKFHAIVPNASKTALCHWTTDIKYGENIYIGEGSGINKYCTIGAHSKITIGKNVRISKGAILETAGLDFSIPPPYRHVSKPITIEDGVWIASNVIVLGGVTIGKGALIGAGVVVSKNIEPHSIVVGPGNRLLDKKTPFHD